MTEDRPGSLIGARSSSAGRDRSPVCALRERPALPPEVRQALVGARRTSGLSLREVGRRIGTSGEMVRQVEAGLCRPSRPVALRLGLVLGLDADQIEALVGASAIRSTDRDNQGDMPGHRLDPSQKSRIVQVRFPASVVDDIDAAAAREGIVRGELVRRALARELERIA